MRLSRALAVLAVPLALTACSTSQPASSGGTSAAGAPSSTQPSSSDAASPAASDASPATSAAATAGAAPSALPVLASRPFAKGLAAELNTVAVHDGVTTVNFTVRNLTQAGNFQTGQHFTDGIDQHTADGKRVEDDFDTVDGVYLVDTAKAQRYLPGRSPSGECACSHNTGSTFVSTGESVVLSAVFKAVPAETKTVSVYIPQVGMFDNVPVGR